MVQTYKRFALFALTLLLPVLVFSAPRETKYRIRKPADQAELSKTSATTQFHGIKQGFDIAVWMGNMSCMGLNYSGASTTPDGFGLEYPKGRGIEHLFGAAPWIGALVDTATSGPPRIIKAVTTGYEGWTGPFFEFHGNPDGRDTFFITSDKIPNGHNIRGFDDDGDGKIDEDELNGVDDDHDGLIDEDYGAISEHDAYVTYSDIYGDPNPILQHVPLGVKVWQRSLAWAADVKEPILPFEYYFINVGTRVLNQVYVGFFADADVGPKSVGGYYGHDFSAYMPDLRTAYVANPQDRPSTPVGFTVLGTPKSLDSLCYTFQWYPGPQTPSTDLLRYNMMASCFVKPDEYPALSDTRFFFSFGAFDSFKPGDTLKIVMAIESGEGISQGPNNLRDNAAKALELYSRGWTTPPTPGGPPLHISVGNDRVTLNWKWQPGDVRCDPLQTWDDSNKFIGALPPDHWRRRNSQNRCDLIKQKGLTGGRTFEGFRVWRSTSPVYDQASFALLAQYDVHDNLGFGEGGVLEDPTIDSGAALQGYTYTDSNLVRGRYYWYAVTSFSIPGVTVVQTVDTNHVVTNDTLTSPALESAFTDNDTLVIIPFAPSKSLGEVKVVPNPYRTDQDYTAENGGWEGVGRNWSESQRVIWFIHLPAVCTVRIFTLTGDIVATLRHDDPERQALERLDGQPRPVGQEEWHLLSESGRAVASGVYIYTVESQYGRQIGKFVIIR
ncbi:MAG TPA: hypothetical protein VMH23_16285 [Bacteroidota bacterium]|nr:hypothetical protein [Bacteroidota bacterium]